MAAIREKIVKTVAAVLSIVILIALTGFALLYFEAQSYLNKNLSELVDKKSKGKYVLTFENLTFNFKQWGIEINQLSFHPSDSLTSTFVQTNSNKQFYSFSSPNVQINGIKLFQLILKKKLELGEILISQPELVIHGKQNGPDDQKNNLITLVQELKPLVTKSFKSIKIDKIELSNASFDFYKLLGDTRKLANAENITFGILNFYTDSLLLPNPNRLFDTEDIYLRMQNYQNKLADSIHSLSAEFVTYSLKHSQIEAKNVELKPINQRITEKARYQILVPNAKITSTHIKDFYRNNSIPIDSLILKDAKISYWPGEKLVNVKMETVDQFNLYDLIKNELSNISIQNFKLQNAELKLFKSQTDLTNQQELKKINIKLEDFLLDSLSLQDTSRIFYSKHIDFTASDYELILGDNIHRVKAGYLKLSTQKNSVLVKNIQISPLQTEKNNNVPKNTIDVNCDSIRLDQFNFKKAFHEKRFVFQKINLFNPQVKLIQNQIAKKDTTSENPSFIYNLISKYVKGIYSKQVTIQKGKIQLLNKTGVIQTGNIVSTIKLQLGEFALDEISVKRTDRLFYANQIELNFSDYQMQLVDQLHKLTIGNLSISTKKREARLQNFHLFPVVKENIESWLKRYNRNELYEFTIPELSLLNADFHNAFFNKKLVVDTLSIKSPQIYYENFALLKQSKPKVEFDDLFELLSDYLDEIQIGKVMIPDGTIKLINHSRKGKTISLDNKFSLTLENTLINKDQFDQKRLLFSEFVDFSVRDHLIRLSDNVHVIKAGEVGFSTRRKEVFVINARMYPETNSLDFSNIKWNIQLTLPELRIKGINIEEFYFDHKIDADNLLISSPDIKIYQKQKDTNAKDIKEVTFPLPKEIESIAIRKFSLTDGSLKVFSELGIKPFLLVQSDLKMEAQNILILKNIEAERPEFKTGDYTGKLLQFTFTPKDKNQQFSIEELSFSTLDRRIMASNLVVKPITKSLSKDQFELHIPSLAMNGFDMDNAYRNDLFSFESIVTEKPTFKLYNNEKDSSKFNPYKVDLYPHFESFADVFTTKKLSVKDADISVFKSGQMKFNEIVTFNLANVRIDKNPSHGFLNADDFSFKIPNIKRQEKLYHFSIGETSYSSKNNRFVAKDIRVIPNYSKENHQKQVKFQSDYYSGSIDSICIEHPNINRWFDKNELTGKYLTINGLNLDIYRDLQLPFDENRRPKMIQDMIKSSKYKFALDSFKFENSSIIYTEQPASGDDEGKIRFNHINARLMPFTNMKTSKGIIPDFEMTGSSTIMDSCQLKVNMNYEMNNPENRFTVSGNLSPFNMHILNPVLEPLAKISIRSGHVDSFGFSFIANKTSATGDLLFGYNDLHISVLETKNGNTREAKFASFLANSLLVKNKNPRGKELLPEAISFQRDQKHSILNYWWKSIFSGVRNTLGFKEKHETAEQ
jgi:hypothetical protein